MLPGAEKKSSDQKDQNSKVAKLINPEVDPMMSKELSKSGVENPPRRGDKVQKLRKREPSQSNPNPELKPKAVKNNPTPKSAKNKKLSLLNQPLITSFTKLKAPPAHFKRTNYPLRANYP